MKIFTRYVLSLSIVLATVFGQSALAQSVLNPADAIVNYNSAAPPTQPAWGTIGKWVRTPRVSWNTSSYKCYIYKGTPFRLLFPKTYNPTANDGKKYPMMIFYHGVGEASNTPYDNEYQLYHGGDVFLNAVNNGTFDGYVIALQTAGGWGANEFQLLKELIDYMGTNNKLDIFHVTGNGLSGGGGGTWAMFLANPTYNAGIAPMSGVDVSYANNDIVTKCLYQQIWNLHGGLDGSPAPATASVVNQAMLAAGAHYVDKNYVTLGHGVWDSVWQEPDFWPFMNRAYAANPWPLFGRTKFCPGDPINVTIGLVAGFQAYQWRKDGVVLSSTTNTITATATGTYDARVQRGGVWSDWSHIPVVISIQTPTVTPPISISGLMSKVIPATDGKNFVNLQVPDSGYTSYTWKRVGSDSVVGNTRIISATQPGQYIVSVTQQFGCSSIYSPPFRVVNAAGPNAPSPASNAVANPVSFTQMELDWARNPNPANKETGFEIYRSKTTGGPYTYAGIVPADTVRFIDNGLTPNTKYYYVVRAVDSTGAAAISNEANAVTTSDKTPPTAPTNVRATSTSFSSVTLAWTPSTDNVAVSNYFIYVNGVKSYSAKATDSSFIVSGLSANQQYTFYVVAIDGSGNQSSASNQVSAASVFKGLNYTYYTTPNGWSVLPDFTTLTPVMSGVMPNVSISNATQANNFGYVWKGYIRIPVAGTYTFATSSDDGSAMWFNKQTATGTPTVANDGLHGTQQATSTAMTLQPGTYPVVYEFFQNGGGAVMTVSWACSALFGDNNQHAIADTYFASPYTPAGTAPAAPTQIKATAQAYNKVQITWTDNSTTENGFEVYRATSSAGPFVTIATTGANATSYTDSTAQAATTYYYKVQAINQYGSSGFDAASLGGVSYSLYTNYTFNNLAQLNSQTPFSTGSQANVSLSAAGTQTTNYALKFAGTINIPTTGTYQFWTASDDGSNMYLGGYDSAHLIVKNDFLQGTTERGSATMNLTAGSYPIYVTYFQQGGGVALTASYQGPGISKQNIPDAAFINTNSRATTFALPTAPSKPYNVVVTALSSSKIGLSWQDSSATVNGFQILRSVGDSTHFILLSSPAATATSFTDTALFSNLTYYYKIVATGVGGNSPATAVYSAMTLDNLPVITKLPKQSARYGTTTTVKVSATSVNSGALVFTGSNLPGFASLVDNGDRTATLTLNPVQADQGNYTGLKIIVTDVFNGKDTTTFDLNVNNNYAPVIDTIANYTINENDTLTIPISASENNSANALTVSATNLPSGFTLTPTSNGKANLFVHPSFAGAGVYNVQVKVDDANGLSTVRTFVLTVKDKDPNSKVYMRVYMKNTVGAPWNSLTGTTTTGLKDDAGNTTTMGLSIDPWWWFTGFDAGATTGNNSGIYPDAVSKDFYIFGAMGGPDSITATLTGLDTTQVYNLSFFSSSVLDWQADNGTTTFRVGSQKVGLAVQGNTQNTVSISNLKAAADGTIPIVIGKAVGSNIGFWNAIVVTTQFDDGTAPVTPTGLSAQNAGGQVQLNWSSAAYNATGFEVWRAPVSTGTYTLAGTASGNSARTFTDGNISSNTAYFYKVRAINTHGVSGYSDSVSLTTLNRLPKINVIADVALKNNAPQTIQVTTDDDPTAQLTLTATNLPPFVTFTDNGNGTGTLNINPTAGTLGVFPNVKITVKDGLDSMASTTFTISVTEPNVSSVYVNFTDGSMQAPKPWNSLVGPPFSGLTLSNLLDDSNVPTSISVKLVNGFSWTSATGMRPRNGTTVYPEAVTRNSFYEPGSTVRTIQVSGLTAGKKYNFQLFSSYQDGLSALTKFTINGVSQSIQASFNKDKVVAFNNVIPDGSGNVTISVAKDTGSSNAFVNALVIQAYDGSGGLVLNPADLRVVTKSRTTARIQWQDRSDNETGFEVWRASDSTGSYSQIKTLPANATSYTDNGLSPNSTYYYIVRAVNATTQSNYSNIASLTTYSYQVYINFTGTSNATMPWNNLLAPPQVGYVWNNFFDSTGAATSMGMTVTNPFAGIQSLGNVTGNNSGIYPDAVLLDDYILFPGQVGGLALQGLNLSLKYDLTFMSSTTTWGDNTTAFAVGGDTVLLDASINAKENVTMFNVSPLSDGTLGLNVLPYTTSSQGGLINAWIVQGYLPSTHTAPAVPGTPGNAAVKTTAVAASSLRLSQTVKADSVVSAYPNPFKEFFSLTVPADNGDKIQVGLYDLSGKLVFAKQFNNLVQGDNFLRIEPNYPLTPGTYIVRVAFAGGKASQTIKLIKQ
ncbi:MAG: fibronectin type III domain-containing protein [Bacteroidetes bacterium]|nr:fibronectin type III domain-containing protein [Bacteroidota bacterium]